MSAPHNDPAIADLRAEIDALDHRLLTLLAERMNVVVRLAQQKRAAGLKVRDPAREAAVIAARKSLGATLGLGAEFVESVFRLVMRQSRDAQAALRVEMPLTVDAKTIAVIGGKGGIGKRMAELFVDLGHEVLIVDLDTELTAQAAATRADVTLVAVPIAVTADVIRQVGPHVPERGLLMDVTSIKKEPMSTMMASTRASVVGTHPMFGPATSSFQGQRVVICDGRPGPWSAWLEANFLARGLVVTRATADEHDHAMALVQVLTHYQTQVLGVALARMGMPLESGLKFTSPAYLMELYVAARHFGQDPALYGPIEMENPLTELVTRTFGDAARHVRDVLMRRDQAAFSAMFDEVRAFFGRFSEEATEQSKFLIDRLVERS